MVKARVLFLCTGNSARSQMAEAFLRRYGGDGFEAFSAGFEAQGINPLTRQVMAEIGFDLEGQRSKGISEFMGRLHFAYTVTVCDQAEERCPTVFPGMGRRLHWPFADPAAFQGSDEERLEAFRSARDAIRERIQAWLAEQVPATE